MNSTHNPIDRLRAPFTRHLIATSVSLTLCLPQAYAAATDLADLPLANAPTVTVLPNIFFILDDSGSMDWNYMPDYVIASDGGTNGQGLCRDIDGTRDNCQERDPPFMLSSLNRIYYNPMITYTPPKNSDGTSKTSYGSPWTAVPKDGYGIQEPIGTTTNLVTGYPDRTWCNSAALTTCKAPIEGGVYTYPNSTYRYPKDFNGPAYYYTATVEWCATRDTGTGVNKNFGLSTCQANKSPTHKFVKYSGWTRKDIIPANAPFPGPNGTTRTYAEEMTNFANWYAWYRTRMQMMKTGVGQAFVNIRGTPNPADPTDKDYLHARVGLTMISSTNATPGSKFLGIDNFDTAQKNTFFTRLYAANPSPSTPLRGALSKAGRYYAGKIGTDPVQYSCQKNFAILSTDGYWNTGDETTTYTAKKIDNLTDVGDQDGAATVSRPLRDQLAKSNTLADVAYYYYHTDLRTPALNNCTGALGTDVCNNDVPPTGVSDILDDRAPHQHMTTFTIGLGVDGILPFQDNYKTANSGTFYDIKQGTKNWPDPIANTAEERIDDLWHAAVNGHGTYFSGRDPESLVNGLNNALNSIQSQSGSGAAAATSNLQPIAGDNYIYIANYRTVNWDGELSAYTLDLTTGVVAATATWSASGGTYGISSKIAADGNSDSRTIYTWSSGAANHLKSFTWANLSASEKALFDTTKLSQYAALDATEKAAATGDSLVKYLRGQDRYEDQDRLAAYGTYYRLYRDREKMLGDIVHSQPVYVKLANFDFLDAGYDAFKTSTASRAGTVYVASNDGMLHAFDSSNGAERWAYVPPLVMKQMWRLADKDYATNHRFFMDGPIAINDVYISGSWKTILVGSHGKGGRGIYALDITDPLNPQALWNYTADDNPNLGFTYGVPLFTKLADGTWSVVIASGYNNIPGQPNTGDYPTSDGVGRVFVLNAATGGLIREISTGVGTTTTPAGLAHLNLKVLDFNKDNTAVQAYGGDLYGNLWRFDLNTGAYSKVAALGSSRPIAVPPEIGDVDGRTVLYFGTGRYLGSSDLANTDTQAIYAIYDDGTTTVDPSTQLQQQTMANTVDRTLTGVPVNWASQYGWFINLPESGERVHLPTQLFFGTLLVGSMIPTATACQPGGFGYLYQIDYKTGLPVVGYANVATYFTSPLVGMTVSRLPSGAIKIYGIRADGGVPTPSELNLSSASSGGIQGKRTMWRELAD